MNPKLRLQNLIAFGQTQAAMRDMGPTPLVQAQFGDLQVLDDLQIIQHFGFSSSPPAGANVATLFGGGNKSKGIILGTVDPASRRRMLLTGETVVHDVWGNEVHLSQSGVTIRHATQVTIAAPNAVIQAPNGLRVLGPITSTGEITAHCDVASVSLGGHRGHTSLGGPPTPGT